MIMLSCAAAAGPPEIMSHQGLLTTASGAVVPDGAYELRFRICATPAGESCGWQQTLSVQVASGVYNVLLSASGLADALDVNPAYLDVAITSGPAELAIDPLDPLVMSPRQQFASVPYAMHSMRASVSIGLCNGQVVWQDADAVRLAPYNSGTLVIEIGGVRLENAGALVYSWADLDQGAEEVGRFYYLYVENQGGAPVPIISASSPINGAHPTIASTRYVGEFFNDASGDIAPVEHNPLSGEYRFHIQPWLHLTLPTDARATYVDDVSLAGRVPATARQALLGANIRGDDSNYYFAAAPAAVGEPYRDASGIWLSTDVYASAGGESQSNNITFWLPIDGANPKIARATTIDDPAGGDEFLDARLDVLGWQSLR